MCMEDIRIGRRTYHQSQIVHTSNSALLAAPANERRVAIIFDWANGAETVRVASGMQPTASTGARLAVSRPFREYTIQQHGSIVTDQWFSFGDSDQDCLTVTEVFLRDE